MLINYSKEVEGKAIARHFAQKSYFARAGGVVATALLTSAEVDAPQFSAEVKAGVPTARDYLNETRKDAVFY